MKPAPNHSRQKSATNASYRPYSQADAEHTGGIRKKPGKILQHGLGQKSAGHGANIDPKTKPEHLFHGDALTVRAH